MREKSSYSLSTVDLARQHAILDLSMKSLTKILKDIGLSSNEAAVMSALMEFERLKANELAQKAHLNRTTTYGVIKKLISRGLVTSLQKDGITTYQSIDPGLLPSYIDRQKDVLDQQKSSIEELLPELKRVREHADAFPRVTFFEGLEGVKQAFEDTLENNKGKEIQCLSGPTAIYESLGVEYTEYYVKKRKALGIMCYGIATDSPFTRIAQSNDTQSLRLTKIFPKEFQLNTEINIYDNKVNILSFSKEQPLAVIIEDEAISSAMKTLFKYIDSTL